MKNKIFFRGTGTALVTPFKDDGSVDTNSLKKLVKYQVVNGVDAVIPAGTTGESATLSDKEQAQVIETVASAAGGKIRIIAGAGSNSTVKAIALAKHALECGADGILSVGPYYNKPTQEGFFRHYASIAEAVDAPLIVYNVPGRTGSNIEAATVLRIAEEIPNIAGIKEASGNFVQIMEILRSRPDHFGVWSGDDALTLPMLALGADGVISVVANEAPKLFSRMVNLCLKGNFSHAREIHNRLLPLMNINFVESSPIPVKAALAMMGLISERYRLPLVPLGDKHRPVLEKILEQLGLLD